jgi:hypothetical protein
MAEIIGIEPLLLYAPHVYMLAIPVSFLFFIFSFSLSLYFLPSHNS